MMTKLLIGLLGAGVIATAGYAAATSVDTNPARTISLPGATTSDDSTTSATTEGVSPPAPAPAPGVTTGDDDGPSDISGPCDEAEHRNDPRCTGGAAADDRGADDGGNDDRGGDDRSGHGSGGDDDDRSGSNSGKG